MRWRGRYEICVPEALLPLDVGECSLNVPLPAPTRSQREVALGDCWPAELLEKRQDGLVFAFPLSRAVRRDAAWRLGYEFSCVVSEWDPRLPESGSGDLAAFLRPCFPLAELPRLRGLLRDIGLRDPWSATDKARGIYEWMLSNTTYQANFLPDHAATFTGFGHCIQLVRLYVALCRLAGLPAREACGALAGRHLAGAGAQAQAEDSFTPFCHTWSEFWSGDQGWVPVEPHVVGHGPRVVNDDNFPDARLRAEFSAEGPVYDRYYFGHLDPYRIHTRSWANQLPGLVTRRDGRWLEVTDPGLRLQHSLWLSGQPLEAA
jgi:hypothetical protein